MTLQFKLGLGVLALVGVFVGGCSSGSIGTNPISPTEQPSTGPTVVYQQIELLSRPAVKEVFEAFASHDKTNRSEPYNDNTIKSQILSFSKIFRSTATANVLQTILYPNVMKADLSQNVTTASYLGYETGGATGSKFGGCALLRTDR